jgi:hypothetical protein
VTPVPRQTTEIFSLRSLVPVLNVMSEEPDSRLRCFVVSSSSNTTSMSAGRTDFEKNPVAPTVLAYRKR